MSFLAEEDLSYAVEWMDELNGSSWSLLASPHTGTGAKVIVFDSRPPARWRFYRVRVE